MSGAIIPEPFMKPTRLTVFPSTTACVTAALGNVSVVMMVAAASSQVAVLPAVSLAQAEVRPERALSIGSGTPITPVEATNICSGVHPSAAPAASRMACTAATPLPPVKALELPALTTSARADPPVSALRHQSTSGDGHFDWVSTPATDVPGMNSASVRSVRSHAL